MIIRCLVEQNIVILTKPIQPERMAENPNVFDFALSDEDKADIAKLDEGESQFFNHQSVDAVKWMAGRVLNV